MASFHFRIRNNLYKTYLYCKILNNSFHIHFDILDNILCILGVYCTMCYFFSLFIYLFNAIINSNIDPIINYTIFWIFLNTRIKRDLILITSFNSLNAISFWSYKLILNWLSLRNGLVGRYFKSALYVLTKILSLHLFFFLSLLFL